MIWIVDPGLAINVKTPQVAFAAKPVTNCPPPCGDACTYANLGTPDVYNAYCNFYSGECTKVTYCSFLVCHFFICPNLPQLNKRLNRTSFMFATVLRSNQPKSEQGETARKELTILLLVLQAILKQLILPGVPSLVFVSEDPITPI